MAAFEGRLIVLSGNMSSFFRWLWNPIDSSCHLLFYFLILDLIFYLRDQQIFTIMFPQIPVQSVDQLFKIRFKRFVRELLGVLRIALVRISTLAVCSCGLTGRAGIYSLTLWWNICVLILSEVVAIDVLIW